MARYCFDIESNGFIPAMTVVHCIVMTDVDTGKQCVFDGKYLEDGIYMLQDAEEIIGHNIIGFDIPAIQKIYPWFKPKGIVTDTLIMSNLIYTNLQELDTKQGKLPSSLRGRHGLAAWGHRLGFHKGDYMKEMQAEGKDPWAEYNDRMRDYCINDVDLNVLLYRKMLAQGFSNRSIRIEHEVREICNDQERFGVHFNNEKAVAFYSDLGVIRMELEKELREVFDPWHEPNWFTPKRDNKTRGYKKGVPFDKGVMVEFNPSSRQHIAKRLTAIHGWKPRVFTDKGQPKIDEKVLSRLVYPEVKLLMKYLLINKRISQLAEGKGAWLKKEKGGRIYGRISTNGAVTGRATHTNPNLGQVPKSDSPYGSECRELFEATPGKSFVGADASGLELRCLAHYLARYDGGAYGTELLKGDIHTANQIAAGLPDRDRAKTFIYAFLYGAGDQLVGEIIGKGRKEGKNIKARFMLGVVGIEKLIKGVQKATKRRGKIKGLDGRFIHIRYAHAALNSLLQSCGGIIMKQAMINYQRILIDEGLVHGKDYSQVLWVHDEFQAECQPELKHVVGQAMVTGMQMTTEQFAMKCPIDAEYKIGLNWSQTH